MVANGDDMIGADWNPLRPSAVAGAFVLALVEEPNFPKSAACQPKMAIFG
jgi:hypothetical protein